MGKQQQVAQCLPGEQEALDNWVMEQRRIHQFGRRFLPSAKEFLELQQVRLTLSHSKVHFLLFFFSLFVCLAFFSFVFSLFPQLELSH
jgi:hypothetical protein